jgi:hypothetical protein
MDVTPNDPEAYSKGGFRDGLSQADEIHSL